ncbi:putative KOW motif-containing protein [Seiridium cardinale]|uniref:KOW motif-containing protein n=1 Tax=Seiridium cardinale TaxID=138064 RepID=A0ABR2XYF6_9PEZI
MQKILKRVATAERVAAKRKAARDRQAWNKERFEEQDEVTYQRAQMAADIGRAKRAIKDDWHLGPNAPNINVGENGSTHGAISEARYQMSITLKDYQKEARCAWLGGSKNLNLVEGDRVVLLEGPDKGKIGKVTSVQKDKMEVIVEGLNKSNVRMPVALIGEGKPPGISIELPISISGVRLVHPVRDPKTGETKDVIINQLQHSGFARDRVTGMSKWSRVVPGLNMRIPWPQVAKKDIVDHKVDTLRIDVEERTFIPTLLRPPMPESVIDELRNKYSRFRTRHEPEYLAAKEAEEQAKKDRVQLMDSMRTPLQEFHRAERERKKKKGKPRLTAEMLEEIGKVIARNQERSLNAAGVSDVSSTTMKTTGAAVPPGLDAPSSETTPPPPSS